MQVKHFKYEHSLAYLFSYIPSWTYVHLTPITFLKKQ